MGPEISSSDSCKLKRKHSMSTANTRTIQLAVVAQRINWITFKALRNVTDNLLIVKDQEQRFIITTL